MKEVDETTAKIFPMVEIELNHIGLGFVKVNGEQVPGSFAVSFESAVGDVARVTIKQFCRAVIKAPADVTYVKICPSCREEMERQIITGGPIGTADVTTREDLDKDPPWRINIPAPRKDSE
jgi:hypothetical protein